MPLQFIIDGYNIINNPFFLKAQKKAGDARQALLDFVRAKQLSRSPQVKISIVFDGFGPVGGLKKCDCATEVIFSRHESADERIRKMLEAGGHPKNVIVVSDDKEIRIFARLTGAKSVGVEEFVGFGSTLKPQPKGVADLKPELNYGQIEQINKELKKIWLR